MKVNNMPDRAKEKAFTVVCIVDGEAWFYGAWDDSDKAIKTAIEVGGMVIPISEVRD